MSMTNEWLQPRDSEFLVILRSLSIFIIVFGHVGGFWVYPPWTEFLHVFVPIFFFLSGAVSYNAFLRRTSVAQYLLKRILGLLIPYYAICIFALFVFLAQQAHLPAFNSENFIKWLTIAPSDSIMPFPLGQVWFLHTLLIICLVSPILFLVYQSHPSVLYILLCCSFLVAAVQVNYNIAPFFVIAGHDLFKAFVHSSFFCMGFLIIDSPKLRSLNTSLAIVLLGISASVVFVMVLDVNPDYAKHTYAPDLYYVSGSISAIWGFILLQHYILRLYYIFPVLMKEAINFFFRHTFAIYLLHSFAILLVETTFGLVNPQQKTISYGIVKLVLVLLVTLAMSPFFTRATSFVDSKVLILTGCPARPSNGRR